MAQILGSVRVGGFIAPTDSTDIYATHDSTYGRGGHREVATLADRDAIPADRTRVGMTVYVNESADTYQLTASGWVKFGGGSAAATISITAGENLGGHRAILATGLYADNGTLPNSLVIGITTGAVSSGASAAVQTSGEMTEVSWTWDVSKPVYLGTNGLLTQIVPTTGVIVEVGKPTAVTKLLIEIQPPIVLA